MHALVAVSTFFLLISSWWMMALPLPSEVFTYRVYPFQLHKNVGLTIVVFVLIMLYVRLSYVRAARAPGATKHPMPMSAVVQNTLLYSLVLACSASGYLSSS
jgi:cytochrome b561